MCLYNGIVLKLFCNNICNPLSVTVTVTVVEVVGWGIEDDEHGKPVKYWKIRNSWGTYCKFLCHSIIVYPLVYSFNLIYINLC